MDWAGFIIQLWAACISALHAVMLLDMVGPLLILRDQNQMTKNKNDYVNTLNNIF